MEAGAVNPNQGKVLVPAGMSEAWRTFCRLLASEVPGTRDEGGRVQVFLSITSVAPKALTERSERKGYKFDRKQVTSQGILSSIVSTDAVAVHAITNLS